MKNQTLYRIACFLAFSTIILIMAGGLVTSTGSGLSVPDWPLSYGQFFPPMVGGIRFEHSHRVIAGSVGIFTLIFMIIMLKFEKRSWVKNLAIAASLAVIIQAILGGMTVKYLLPRAVSVAHACLGQTFFTLVSLLALFTSQEWLSAPRQYFEKTQSIQRLFIVTSLFIYGQLIFGAMVRHGKPDDPIIYFHYGFAFLIFLHSVLIAIKVVGMGERFEAAFSRHSLILLSLVILQVFLGFGAFFLTRWVEREYTSTVQILCTTAHQSIGALILATSVLLTARSLRLLTDKK